MRTRKQANQSELSEVESQSQTPVAADRREFMQSVGVGIPAVMATLGAFAGVSGAAGALLGSSTAQAGEAKKSGGKKAGHGSHADHGPSPAAAKLALAAADCAAKGEICLSHCVSLLATGDKTLGDCAKLTLDMIAFCKATSSLAASGSSHLKVLAAQAAEVCKQCAEECKKHADHHTTCKECMDACLSCAKACQELA